MRWRVATSGLQREPVGFCREGRDPGPYAGVLPRACDAKAAKMFWDAPVGLLKPGPGPEQAQGGDGRAVHAHGCDAVGPRLRDACLHA